MNRAVILGLWACLMLAAQAAAQESRRLDDRQRAQILSLIEAVDEAQGAGTAVEVPEGAWSVHILKATAGVNYIPMTMRLPIRGGGGDEVAVYVRAVAKTAEAGKAKSALERWLVTEALKAAPRPAPFRGFVFISPEEMPVGLAVSSRRVMVREPGAHSIALTLNEQAHLRADEARREAERAARREKEEGRASTERTPADDAFIYPFEDFGFMAGAPGGAGGPTELARAIAVPPGDYDVYVAARAHTADRNTAAVSTVYHTALSVPSYDTGELTISGVILADRLGTLAKPYSTDEQSSHPYALGWTEIVPARDSVFADSEQLGVVFQVLNPSPGVRGKPDVTIDYAFHPADSASDPVTARHDFSSRTLPEEFDLEKGHQVFAAQAIPLASFAPGRYRLEIRATDNVARRTAARELDVTIRATPGSLWLAKTIEGVLAPPFQRDQVLSADAVGPALDALALAAPVAASLRDALSDARGGRWAAVLGAVPAGTNLASSFLRGLALLALSDNLESAAHQFRDALRFSSDFMPATFYLGACYAANGRDREAVAAWQLVSAAGAATPFTAGLLADALMRLEDPAGALDILQEAGSQWPHEPGLDRRTAAAQVKAGRRDESLATLDALVARQRDDVGGLFLAIYLLADGPPGRTLRPADRDKLDRYARAYLAVPGPHRAIVSQWLEELASSAR
jgi:tetratricopeptide (TPR) repeat protein